MAIRRTGARVPGLRRNRREQLARWIPVVLWALLISVLSTGWFTGERTGSFLMPLLRGLFPAASHATLVAIHHAVRKLAHFLEYLVLSVLLSRALRGRRTPPARVAVRALALAALYAVGDELHQAFAAGRTASVVDCLIDVSGAAVGQAVVAVYDAARARARSEERFEPA
jgi:VanZ family protein